MMYVNVMEIGFDDKTNKLLHFSDDKCILVTYKSRNEK